MKCFYSKNSTTLFAIIFSIFMVSAQSCKKNTVIPSVNCKQTEGHSYALFLPENYTHDKKWPVVLIFDPGARGTMGVTTFVEAAREFGYILACSNNSRNYNEKIVDDSVNAVWKDIMTRFSIDPDRIYTAGMSGGARVASLVADQTGKISAVIACAAGFDYYNKPDSKDTYGFVAIIGEQDFNYREMDILFNTFQDIKLPYHLIRTEGSHNWPEASDTIDAFKWLEYHAMKAGKIRSDKHFISDYYQKRKFEFDKCIKNNKLVIGAEKLTMLINDFGRQQDINDLKKLKNSHDYLRQHKSYISLRSEETSLINEISNRIRWSESDNYTVSQNASNAQWVKHKIQWVNNRLKQSNSSDRKVMLNRVLHSVRTFCYEMIQLRIAAQKYEIALKYYKFYELLLPENNAVMYNKACLYSLMNKKKQALKTLKKAVDLGFDDLNLMNEDSDLNNIRPSEEFQNILNTLKK